MRKHILTASIAIIGLLLACLPSRATLSLRVSADGGATWTTVVDGDANDEDPTVGSLSYFASVPPNWSISVDSAFSMPFEGSAVEPYVDLFSQDVSTAPGTLIVQMSQTDYTSASAARILTNFVGGTTQGVATFNAYMDTNNVLFGKGTPLTVQGPFDLSSFSGTVTAPSVESGGGPFSMTIEEIVTHSGNGRQVSSFDSVVQGPPIPPVPSIGLIKQVACLQPTNDCSDFGKVASGFKGLSDPAFCYLVTITNNGTLFLTNVVINDSLLGDVTTNFYGVGVTNGTLTPGATLSTYLKMQLDTTTTNIATVTALALNDDGTTNTSVVAADSAVANVDQAGLTTTVTLNSQCDTDGVPGDNHVLLPGCGEVCVVSYNVQICNTGAADLTGVTLFAPRLAPFGCTLPGPFDLPKGACTNFSCQLTMQCTNSPQVIKVTASGQVAPDSTHCAVYDLTSTNVVMVNSSSFGTIECAACTCTAGIFGSVVLNCGPVTDLTGSPAMTNVAVTLFDSSNNVAGVSITDMNGIYSFTNLAAGTYVVQVTPLANYSETYPAGVTDGKITVVLATCEVTNGIEFAYGDETTPNIIGAPLGGDLGVNPSAASLPTDQSIAGKISASDDRGPIKNTTVTHVDSSNACMASRLFTIIVGGTCNATTQHVTFSWTTDMTPPTITVPPGCALGCNPSNLPTDASIKLLVKASDNCGVLCTNVSHLDVTNGCGIMRTFTVTATDNSSNISGSKTVVFTWTIDTNKPVITVIPIGTTLGCNPPSSLIPTDAKIQGQVTATDNCGSQSIVVTHCDTNNGCSYMRTFTVTAVDGCGNVSVPSQVIYTWTVDTTKPVLKGQGSNLVIYCPAIPVFKAPTVTEGCSGGAVITNVDTFTPGSCANSYSVTRTWMATDACGNVSLPVSQTVTVVDATAPDITCPSNVVIYTNITITNCSKQMYCTFKDCDWAGPCNNNNYNYGSYGHTDNYGANCWWNNNWNNNWSGSWNNYCSTWTNFWSNSCGNNGNNSGGCNWNNFASATTNCWGIWNQGNISSCQWLPCAGNNPGTILTNCYKTVYGNGCVQVGLSNGYCMKFTSCDAVRKFLTNTCNSTAYGPLNCSASNPTSCNAGSFCSKVLALQLNCDISDNNNSGCIGKCGDLYLNDNTSPCNGMKVRDILCLANKCLGGGNVASNGCTVSNLCGLLDNLNCSFQGCQPSAWCSSHLACQPTVTAPSPSLTGTATATHACDGAPVVTYTDSMSSTSCSNIFVFLRTWKATDACGNSSTCTQTITLMPPPCTVTVSGNVAQDCNGDGHISNDPGLQGVTLTLKSNNIVIATDVTDANGDYSFSNILAGKYTVVITPLANYSVTYPYSGGTQSMTVANCQDVNNVNFGLAGNVRCLSVSWNCPTTAKCGQAGTYTCTVVNTGTTCFTSGCQISSSCFGGWTQTCPTSLAPGQSCTFTKSYTYKSGDCGTFHCNATCTGYCGNGYNCSGQNSCSTQVSQH